MLLGHRFTTQEFVDSMVLGGKYAYMEDLRTLANRVAPSMAGTNLPPNWSAIITPLVADEWQRQLMGHPDQEFTGYLLRGITEGFRIGFNYCDCKCKSAKRNMQSAIDNPQVVREYLALENGMGRIVGPIEPGIPGVIINRFGVIPKPHQPGKWRLIVDLSHPKGASVNDGIEPELCTLTYASIDNATSVILQRGQGTLLAKLDLESAYRIMPVHPHDRHLLGMQFDGKLYVDAALPFGLRSAPKLFTALADGLLWIMSRHGIKAVLHYLDDYIFFGSPETQECAEALKIALQLCQRLGVPVSKLKVEGPTTTLAFLGILLDTVTMELRLPVEKLRRLKLTIQQWQLKRSCTKRELLSLIGQLQHACRVVRPGRTFLRRMITLSTHPKELHHHVRLNAAFRSDLQWWASFLEEWNGVSMMSQDPRLPPQAVITSDASGNWGCGAFSSASDWFQLQWPSSWNTVHITIKELVPIVLACAIWGRQWQGKSVRCVCDNAAVVAIVNSGSSKDALVMHLMRCLFFFQAVFSLSIHAVHLAGKKNIAADGLSRNNLPLFLQQVPTAKPQPTPLPAELLKAIIHQRPDWTSKTWKVWFNSTLQRV